MPKVFIESLSIYPIKSCGVLSPDQVFVDQEGPRYDRKWMIVDENGIFLTQRTHPKMALIQPSLADGKLMIRINGELFEGHSEGVSREAPRVQTVEVWKSKVQANLIENEALTEALSTWLAKRVKLVEYGYSSIRKVSLKGQELNNSVRFSDGFPWLLANKESLHELNRGLVKTGAPEIPMNRFRPNIVVRGLSSYQEDHLASFKVKGIQFKNLQACSRCPIVTIDQLSGEKAGHEPLAYLASHRKTNGQVHFGAHLVSDGEGSLRVGDELEDLNFVESPII